MSFKRISLLSAEDCDSIIMLIKLFVIFPGIILLFLFIFGGNFTILRDNPYNWPSTSALVSVVQGDVKCTESRSGTKCVNTKEKVADYIVEGITHRKRHLLDSKHKNGQEIVIYFHPKKPSLAIIDESISSEIAGAKIQIILSILLLFVGLIINTILKLKINKL